MSWQTIKENIGQLTHNLQHRQKQPVSQEDKTGCWLGWDGWVNVDGLGKPSRK